MSRLLQHGALTVSNAVEGEDARMLAAMAVEAWETMRAPVLHVVADDARFHTMQDLYAFFAPDIRVMALPAWDSLPYDRVSPSPDILAQRVRVFIALADEAAFIGPTIVIAPVNAVAQRIPDLSGFKKSEFILTQGKVFNRDALKAFLSDQGYQRSATVREPGEYAMRGNIIDIYPAGHDFPIRIDAFDDDVETLKTFDPVEQTSIEAVLKLVLTPTAEIAINSVTIVQFRSRYRELFGAQQSDDPLFEAVSAGHRYPGMEHWLPLFYPATMTLFDVLPERTPLIFDHQMDVLYREHMAQVVDFYNARVEQMKPAKGKAHSGSVYKPVPPPLLFVMEEDWEKVQKRPVIRYLSPFTVDSDKTMTLDAKQAPNFAAQSQQNPAAAYEQLKAAIQQWRREGKEIILVCYSAGSKDRLCQLCAEHGIDITGIACVVLALEHGFVASDLAVVTEQDLLGDRLTRSVKRKRRDENAFKNVSDLSVGDFVVHAEHGIGKFDGLVTITVDRVAHDCVRILYADNDKLFVPVENLEVLSRFGSDMANAQLDRLGSASWQGRKARVKKRLLEMAEGLIQLAAKRKLAHAPDISLPEGSYHEFVARFPYPETEDQERSITDVLNDLHHNTVMDRLVCGDVGFGKTEVAMRAAFVAAMSGLQVALVVPTTLLARQHYANFIQRFKGFPLKLAQLSRMVTAKEATRTRDLLEKGQVDIVIGTHALLSARTKFHNLGLLIIDEEQNFGVKQKEALKEIRENVHVLTLTATPIPRTLQLAMTGIRDLSLIATPPVDRLAVRTSVMPFDPVIIREAILREYHRGGQCFFVCPRVSDMDEMQRMLTELVPEIRMVQAHGQMTATELDERMTAFYEGTYHLLLATNIIESGLDIPNANTLIVHRSDLFGLSQLYQIRGRIGRSKVRGYAYFTYKDDALLTESAKQRLHVINTLDTLGAGFQLASYDMDIRGAGNLLGEEQSGHVREVGVELYQQMLEEAVRLVRSGEGVTDAGTDNDWTPGINLGLPVLIPEIYVSDLPVRLTLYRRLAALSEEADIDAFAAELVDRFGPMPEEVRNLLDVIMIKYLCKKAGVEKIDAGPRGAVITFRRNQFAQVDRLMDYIHKQLGTVKIRPDQKLAYLRAWEDVALRIKGVRDLAHDLAALVV